MAAVARASYLLKNCSCPVLKVVMSRQSKSCANFAAIGQSVQDSLKLSEVPNTIWGIVRPFSRSLELADNASNSRPAGGQIEHSLENVDQPAEITITDYRQKAISSGILCLISLSHFAQEGHHSNSEIYERLGLGMATSISCVRSARWPC